VLHLFKQFESRTRLKAKYAVCVSVFVKFEKNALLARTVHCLRV